MHITHAYRVIALYSGSTGNAFLLDTPGACLLIDAGQSARRLCNALAAVGYSMEDIDAIFITHDHRDHISALETLLAHHPKPVYITAASARIVRRELKETEATCLQCRSDLFCEQIGDVQVQSFLTPHDSEMSVGYRISFPDGTGNVHTVGYATDLGYISPDVRRGLLGCETVALESNHDLEMLMSGPYPYQLKERIHRRYGHLSNTDCASFAAELVQAGMRQMMLVHLSETNNTPDLAYAETLAALGKTSVRLMVAAPHEPVILEIPLPGEAVSC